MRQSTILLLFLFANLTVFGQGPIDTVINRERLKKELVKYDKVETWCLGYSCNSISNVYRTADSLFSYCDLSTAMIYLNDTSYPLRFYSFLFILGQNDSLGFEILKENISDTQNVFSILSDVLGYQKFNYLLAKSYKHFIDWKYFVGGNAIVFEHVRYSFPPKDLKVGRRKLRQLNKLTSKYGILHE